MTKQLNFLARGEKYDTMLRSNDTDRSYSDSTKVTVRVEKLTKVYISSAGRVVSLNDVSFSVNKGEFVDF